MWSKWFQKQLKVYCTVVLREAAKSSHRFITVDVPELLRLSSQVLQGTPWPKIAAGWPKLTTDDWFRLIPILGCIFVVLAVVFGGSRKGDPRPRNSYWLTRIVMLRGMGLVYLAAFLTSASQNRAMFGSRGLMPLQGESGRPIPVFRFLDSMGLPFGDLSVEVLSWIGVLMSLLLATGDRCFVMWAPLPFALWLTYLSIVNLGARVVIGYGWEWETLEVGFLMIFLCPMLPSRSGFPPWLPPPNIVIWLLRWGTFRLLIGAGMSKLGERSSSCWRDFTCTDTHYYTQPMPNPFAWLFHNLPTSVHRTEVMLTFVEQLILPFAVLAPLRCIRISACLAELFFQLCIVGTGNYAWINWIGALPCIALLDDGFLSYFFRTSMVESATKASAEAEGHLPKGQRRVTIPRVLCWMYRTARFPVHMLLLGFILCKSAAPLKELFSPAPWLAYYDDYFFVNAQGVFGFINKHRVNLVLHYTHDPLPELPKGARRSQKSCADTNGYIAQNERERYACADLEELCGKNKDVKKLCPWTCGICNTSRNWDERALRSMRWKPLEFKNLPGAVTRRPQITSPYHYRLDWETWIQTTASMERYIEVWEQERRARRGAAALDIPLPGHIRALVRQILAGDTDAMSLMGTSVLELLQPANNKTNAAWLPPTAIRAEFYSYKFTTPTQKWRTGAWWTREKMSQPHVFERAPMSPKSASEDTWAGIARSPWQRHWVLFLSVFGAYASLCGIVDSVCSLSISTLTAELAGVLYYMACFALALAVDYEHMELVQQISKQMKASVETLPWYMVIAVTSLRPGFNGVVQLSILALVKAADCGFFHLLKFPREGFFRNVLVETCKCWWDVGRSLVLPTVLGIFAYSAGRQLEQLQLPGTG